MSFYFGRTTYIFVNALFFLLRIKKTFLSYVPTWLPLEENVVFTSCLGLYLLIDGSHEQLWFVVTVTADELGLASTQSHHLFYQYNSL